MLMGHTVDDIATSWQNEACPFGVSAPIISHTRCTTRLNVILNLYQRSSVIESFRKRIELTKNSKILTMQQNTDQSNEISILYDLLIFETYTSR